MDRKRLKEAYKIATSSNPLLKGSTEGDKAIDYVGTIIECIEKQMPKKPFYTRDEKVFKCGKCGKLLLMDHCGYYCHACGQAIHWPGIDMGDIK